MYWTRLMKWRAILLIILCNMRFLNLIFLRRSAVERKVEIMGEAINRILKNDPNFMLPNAKDVINTRNRVIHGYDSVTPEFLWGLVIKHIPQLKVEIEKILSKYE